MPCQVGITTDLARRKREWEQKIVGLRNWRRISTHRTRSAAQAREITEAERLNCNYGVGGAGAERATWHVYTFTYTRRR